MWVGCLRSQKSAALKSGAFRLMLVDESMAPSGRLTYHSNALCTSHFFYRCLHDHPRWFPWLAFKPIVGFETVIPGRSLENSLRRQEIITENLDDLPWSAFLKISTRSMAAHGEDRPASNGLQLCLGRGADIKSVNIHPCAPKGRLNPHMSKWAHAVCIPLILIYIFLLPSLRLADWAAVP
jgi:hypothetical protein